MKNDYSHVAIVLDRSGSMESVKSDTIGGFNEFLKKQKQETGSCTFSLVQFDHEYEVLEDFKDINKVSELNNKTFSPRGMTALYDAVGRTITSIGKKLSEMKEEDRPERVIFVIVTDGLENSSKEFTSDKISEMISHQTNIYKWQFMFLGANQDAIFAAGQIGIKSGNAMSYAATGTGVTKLFVQNLSKTVSNYRNMDYATYSSNTAEAFSSEDRKIQEDLINNKMVFGS